MSFESDIKSIPENFKNDAASETASIIFDDASLYAKPIGDFVT